MIRKFINKYLFSLKVRSIFGHSSLIKLRFRKSRKIDEIYDLLCKCPYIVRSNSYNKINVIYSDKILKEKFYNDLNLYSVIVSNNILFYMAEFCHKFNYSKSLRCIYESYRDVELGLVSLMEYMSFNKDHFNIFQRHDMNNNSKELLDLIMNKEFDKANEFISKVRPDLESLIEGVR